MKRDLLDHVVVINEEPILLDFGGDGLSNSEETTLGTNPLLFDTDADGLSDREEVLGQDGDFDGDGAVDLTAGAVVDSMQQEVVLTTEALVSVPEPSAPLMRTLGALALGLLQRRRGRRRAFSV